MVMGDSLKRDNVTPPAPVMNVLFQELQDQLRKCNHFDEKKNETSKSEVKVSRVS
jgi:hypothetical protein